MARAANLVLISLAVALSGCQCGLDDNDLGELDAGQDIPNDAGPAPPEFPLKAGDILQYAPMGARTGDCPDGGCDRALTAAYEIVGVSFDDERQRWTVTANALYQGQDDTITAQAMDPLVISKTAPFSAVTVATPSSAQNASFTTDAPPTDELTPNGFPFFQSDSGAAEVLETSGAAFCERFAELDPDAECDFQAGSRSMEVFFRNPQTGLGADRLHKVRVEYHQMGFVCGWDELMVPFEEGMNRNQGDFEGLVPDLAMIFGGTPPKVLRDGVEYVCSCFSQTCRSSATQLCLTIDPDAEPGECP